MALSGIGLLVVTAVAADPQYQREDWRAAADAIGKPDFDRALVVAPTEPPIFYYQRGAIPMPAQGLAVRRLI